MSYETVGYISMQFVVHIEVGTRSEESKRMLKSLELSVGKCLQEAGQMKPIIHSGKMFDTYDLYYVKLEDRKYSLLNWPRGIGTE